MGKEVRKQWKVPHHCSSLVFPVAYPDIQFNSPCGDFDYQAHACSGVPDWESRKLVPQDYHKTLGRLNKPNLQVKHFTLPVQLMKLHYIDPYSRQRLIEDLYKYLSSQRDLRSVVLEQASITLADLCRLLLAISYNSKVQSLYLWFVLDKCQAPFVGPLQSDINLNDLPRIPFTYNPGGRKYLREVEKSKNKKSLYEQSHISQSPVNIETETLRDISTESATKSEKKSSVCSWVECLLQDDLHRSEDGKVLSGENLEILLKLLGEHRLCERHVYSQLETGVQCDMFQDHHSVESKKVLSDLHTSVEVIEMQIKALYHKAKAKYCLNYLKIYENSVLNVELLREMYKVALNGLTHLTTLSVNYSLLADGTGEALLSIGSVLTNRLRDLELLCLLEDQPSGSHKQYDRDARHAIPDVIWKKVKESCPDLRVHVVCCDMLPDDISKWFITRSIPLCTFNLHNGFCPTLRKHQLCFFSTLKFLRTWYKNTLEHFSVVLWQVSGRIDSSLEMLIKEVDHLKSFAYYGPVQYIATISRLCDAALEHKDLVKFVLMVEGDPCYPEIAQNAVAELYEHYKTKFYDKSPHFQFQLGTHI